ncbi:MFS transporter, partial [Pseudomonas aeruginosa]|nr:MFS transporter [Pseudomonas aeruginosa]
MTAATLAADAAPEPANSTTRVAVASFIGTAIEFFAFYGDAYATALGVG